MGARILLHDCHGGANGEQVAYGGGVKYRRHAIYPTTVLIKTQAFSFNRECPIRIRE